MNRRQILQYTAWITGASVSAPLAGALLSGCSRSPQDEKPSAEGHAAPVLHFFPPESFKRITALADAILPRTDSPSASDVAVPASIDSMIGLIFDAGYQESFRSNWRELELYLDQQGFLQAEPPAQAELLRQLELSADSALENAQAVYLDLKQQTIAYYLTTEEIGENFLNYLPIPGRYEPCISVDDVNNQAWALR